MADHNAQFEGYRTRALYHGFEGDFDAACILLGGDKMTTEEWVDAASRVAFMEEMAVDAAASAADDADWGETEMVEANYARQGF